MWTCVRVLPLRRALRPLLPSLATSFVLQQHLGPHSILCSSPPVVGRHAPRAFRLSSHDLLARAALIAHSHRA
eukprot:scaffold99440_cov63-Phaeocystis_antarctica.AAC.6